MSKAADTAPPQAWLNRTPASPGAGRGSAARQGAADLPVITTLRHDTLWLLAEQHLGSGERFTEIVALNEGMAQPDGRSLGDDGRVYPGWQLRLPADAVLDAERVERHAVGSGDTLWDIAAAKLGDPLRYPEIFDANQGDRQADGGTLEDPDLIRTGWVLELPDRGVASGLGAGVGSGAGATIDDAAQSDAEGAGAGFVDDAHGADASPPLLDRGAASADPDEQGSASGRGVPPLDRATTADSTPTTPATPTQTGSGRSTGAGARDVSPSHGPVESPVPMGAVVHEGTGAGQGSGDTVSTGGERPAAGAVVRLPLGSALTALLLAGIAGELARRRRQFQRHRRPGERMPAPTEGQRSLEAAARDALAQLPESRWETALRVVARQARATGQQQPRIRVVRAGADVHLHLAEPAEPLSPFRAGGDRLWVLDPDWPGADPVDRGHAQGDQGDRGALADPEADPFPALVAVGVAGDATVLVNLDQVGTLQVAGTPALRPEVLRALATEVTLGRARERVARIVCVADASLVRAVEAGDLVIEPDVDRVTLAIDAVISARRSADVPESERATAAALSDPIEIVITDRSLPIEVPGGSGAALVTSAQARRPGAILALDAAGAAVLLPEAIGLVPQSLPERGMVDLVGLLSAADVPDDPTEDSTSAVPGIHSPAPAAPDRDPAAASDRDPGEASARRCTGLVDAGPLRAAREGRPAVAGRPGPAAAERGLAPRILVLGEVRVEGATGRAEWTRVGRLAETAAFVLLNPGARPSALQSALWPGLRSNPQTCRQMISRTRTWLGRTEAGESYLMPFAETGGRLRLRPEVGSDWAQFRALAEQGLADPEDLDSLTAALGLVRGRPFGPVAGRELPWADLSINDMVCLITDVAHALACRHEQRGNVAAARDAALRGLRTESESEVLRGVLSRLPR